MSRNQKTFLIVAGLMALSALCGGISYAVYDHFQSMKSLPEAAADPLAAEPSGTDEPTPPPVTAAAANPDARDLPYQSVVQITAQFEQDGGIVDGWTGSGSIISPDGLILTNAHVVLPDSEHPLDSLLVSITENPDEAPVPAYYAEVAQFDAYLDLAVIRVVLDLYGGEVDAGDLNLPAVPVGDSDELALGDEITILGYPGIGGETITLTSGKVSGFTGDPEYGNRSFIKTNATIAGGNSGGPALNAFGELVGIPTQLGYGGEEGVIDCRILADTNRDGVVDEADSCIPTGGFINSLRPVNLALPYIESAMRGETANLDAVIFPEGGQPEGGAQEGDIVYREDFSDPESGWQVFADEEGGAGYAAGRYQIEVKTPELVRWGVSGNTFDDVAINADVSILRASEMGDVGLVCRYVDMMNFYALGIREDGRASIWKLDDGDEIFLTDWVDTGFRPGDSFRFSASCAGDQLSVLLNGAPVVSAQDAAFPFGDVGFYAGTDASGNLVAAFDNLVVSAP